MLRFQLYPRFTIRGRRWFWRLKAANGETIAQGHTRGYSRRIDAETCIALVQGSSKAIVEEVR